MKVRLLKKLHKRFRWRYDKSPHGNPWRVYDKQYKCEIYPDLPSWGYYYSERTIYALLKLMCLQYLATSVSARIAERRKNKRLEMQRKYWANN